MRRIFLGAILALTALCCPASARQSLTLHTDTGTKIVYFLNDEPSITFEKQDMVVTVDGESTAIPMQKITRWEIGASETTGMMPASSGKSLSLEINGNTVAIHNPGEQLVRIYNLDGHLAVESREAEGVFSLHSGLYIVTSEKETFKIAIR